MAKNDTPEPPREGAGTARGIIEGFLAQYGLQGLAEWAWNLWLNGDEIEEIWLKLRDPSTVGGKVYAERFPAMAQLAAEGRAISEDQYLYFESAVAKSAKKWGIPDGIYNTREAIGDLLVNDVSDVEVESRMRRAAGLVYSDPAIRAEFSRFYGTQGDGAAIAWMLDPEANEVLLQQQYAAAQVAGNVLAQGIGAVSQAQAEMIARAVNPTEGQAQQAATLVGSQMDLYGRLFNERKAVDVDTATSAAFGADGRDVQEVDAAKRRRAAAYNEGGSIASNQGGLTGLGSANM